MRRNGFSQIRHPISEDMYLAAKGDFFFFKSQVQANTRAPDHGWKEAMENLVPLGFHIEIRTGQQ